MKWFIKVAGLLVVAFLICAANSVPATAQALPTQPAITFDSFNANYHLSRDANGHSLLTTEEVIKADFPDNSDFWGINRSIPITYQGHSVAVKVLTVQDASGRDIPYKTSKDKGGNLVLTTGDPKIRLFGFQTYHITYQTQDVVDLNSSSDQFLLDVNGRGWDQSFGSVAGVLYLPKTVAASLTKWPTCYIGYFSTTTNNCTISTQNQPDQIAITAKSNGQLNAHQALVMKLNFKLATFTKPKSSHTGSWLVLGGVLAAAMIVAVRRLAG